MKNQLSSIDSFFKEVCKRFYFVKLECGFDEFLQSFIINVDSTELYKKNEEYIVMEYDFTKKFEKEFPGYELLFVSNDESFPTGKVLLENSNKGVKEIKNENLAHQYQFSDNWKSWEDNDTLIAKSA